MKHFEASDRIYRWGARATRRLRASAADPRYRKGAAAVELAVVSPLLLLLLAGVAEVGMAGYQALQVQAAVEAGVLYVSLYGGSNTAAINQAVVNATSTAGITSTISAFCGCPTAAGVVSQANCTTVCSADNTAPGSYVTVKASIAHQAIMTLASPHFSY
jgi:Flp pilus assembly protein TadG